MTAQTMRGALPWPSKSFGRTNQPVRRKSRPESDADGWYLPQSAARSAAEIMKAARLLMHRSFAGRDKGRRRGALTIQDVAVLEYLAFDAWDWTSGRLDCAYSQICKATGVARATVAQALDRLEALGIIERMRRFKRIEGDDGEVEVHQTNNAYRLHLPPRIRALLGLKPPPEPDDHYLARVNGQIENAEHEAQLTGKSSLMSALGFLGRQVGRQEFTT
jgi:DNA-binding transcriptional ArsR family regulator